MIELIGIILHFFIFLIICSFPLNPKSLNKLTTNHGNALNYIDCHAINIIIFVNILLVASFFNIHINYLFLALLSISIFFLIRRRKEYLSLISRNNLAKFIFFFVITISIFISIAYLPRLEWDGFHWITKALVFFNNEPIQNLKYSGMPMYPHLGGYIWAFFWKNSLLQHEYFGRLFYAYFYIISIFTIFNIAKFKSEKLIYLLIFSLVLITYDSFLLGGYQEYLIFSTLLISSRFIMIIKFHKNIEYKKIFLTLFILSTLMWFKDEGMFYFLIFGSLMIYFQKSSFKKKILPIITILFLIYIQYYLQNSFIGVGGFAIEPFSQGFFDQIQDYKLITMKTLDITKHMVIAFIKYPLWIIIIFSFFWTKTFDNIKNYHIKYFLYALILNVLFIYSVYLHDTNPDPIVLAVTLDRVMFQTSGFYFVVCVLILNKNRIRITKYL